MNKLIDLLISNFKCVTKEIKIYLITFYNETYFLINKNFALSKKYKPAIDEKLNKNKKLQKTLTIASNKNKEAENTILKLENENALLQSKISIIEDLMTKRHY
ncbi:hypothetical protein LGK95_05700 [Clostridium algoriphilum]|uniref:hypothetical protein n=1 Tax=Clostridium algoriphilum TaxID=198347 RepID=UPI001CF4AB0F|nr:hypothetical protein [Clostridium algoriphilum]MCB2293016.1 hypothetical protein [Clostridium algoriphilum]